MEMSREITSQTHHDWHGKFWVNPLNSITAHVWLDAGSNWSFSTHDTFVNFFVLSLYLFNQNKDELYGTFIWSLNVNHQFSPELSPCLKFSHYPIETWKVVSKVYETRQFSHNNWDVRDKIAEFPCTSKTKLTHSIYFRNYLSYVYSSGTKPEIVWYSETKLMVLFMTGCTITKIQMLQNFFCSFSWVHLES